LKFKESVESGHFIPEEIRKKLEEKIDRTPQEEEILQKEKQLQSRKEKVSEMILFNIIMAYNQSICTMTTGARLHFIGSMAKSGAKAY